MKTRERARKTIRTALTAFGLGVFAMGTAVAAPPIYVNGELTSVPAVVRDNQVYVPVRGVFEKLHTAVNYTPPTSVVARKSNTDLVRLSLGSRHAMVRGSDHLLGTAPFLSSERIYVPLRLISEAAGATVVYGTAPHAVRIIERAPVAVPGAPVTVVTPAPAPVEQQAGIPWWVWLLVALVIVGILFALLRRRKPDPVIKTRSSVGTPTIKTRR